MLQATGCVRVLRFPRDAVVSEKAPTASDDHPPFDRADRWLGDHMRAIGPPSGRRVVHLRLDAVGKSGSIDTAI